jgi:hypothetical protein
MAGDSYSLDEVSRLLGVPVPELIQRIEDGAFPGRFLTSTWEMRIPVQDVRRAVETMRAASSGRSLARVNEEGPGAALIDPRDMKEVLDSWWSEREGRLLEEVRQLLSEDDERWRMVEAVLSEVRDRLERLERRSSSTTSEALALEADGWVSEIDGGPGGPVDTVLSELRDLERLLGIGGPAATALPAPADGE